MPMEPARKESSTKSNGVEKRFCDLKARLNKDVRSVSEVYISINSPSLVYRPIGHLDMDEVTGGRERLCDTKQVELAGVEVALEDVQDSDPDNGRRNGTFRIVEWYTPDFEGIPMPGVLKERKMALNKNSSWLRGGPK